MTRFLAIAALLLLSACTRKTEGDVASESRGRYAGVGLYTPGEEWRQIGHAAPTDPAAARLSDDDEVIVVIDSRTGELRQCGNLSGFCIGMNPWTKPLSAQAPTPLIQHAARTPAQEAQPAAPPAKAPEPH